MKIHFKDLDNSYVPHILKEIFIDKIYDPFFRNKKDLVVVDCGANIGLFSLYASKYAKKIYAIEPSQSHHEHFKGNIEDNGIKNVGLVKKALSNTNGTAKFYHSDNVTMFSLKQEVNSKPSEVETVETIMIDKLFEELKLEYVDFLKLDVEGSETEIICGSGFEKVAHKIGALMVEWHAWSNTSPNLLVNALRDYGFKVRQVPNDATLFYAER